MSEFVEVTPELMAGFLDEAPEYLSMLDEGLLAFESKAESGSISLEAPEDQERMNEMFRAAHSLKGLAAAMGFNKMRDLTHLMETLFDHIRMGKRSLDPSSCQTLFSVFDKLRELVGELTQPPDTPVTIDDALAALNEILSEPGDGDAADAAPKAKEPKTNVQPTETAVLEDAELAQLFIETTLETLEELSEGLLQLEQSPDNAELMNQVFRHAHNIKGASGAAGLDGPYRLTHDMETVLDRLRANKLKLEESLSNALFKAVDRLRADIQLVKDGCVAELVGQDPADVFSTWLEEPARNEPPTTKASTPDSGVTENASDENVTVSVTFPKDFAESEIQAYLIHNKLAEAGTIIRCEPDMDTLDGSKVLENITFTVRTDEEPDAIAGLVQSYAVESVKATRGAAAVPAPTEPVPAAEPTAAAQEPRQAPETSAPAPTTAVRTPVSKKNKSPQPSPTRAPGAGGGDPKTSAKAGETIRVDLERLDQLMNLGGELVINKARFVQIQSQFEPVFSGPNLGYLVDDIAGRIDRLNDDIGILSKSTRDKRIVSNLAETTMLLGHDIDVIKGLVRRVHGARGGMNDFSEALHSLNRVSEGIQKRIMETRMVAVGPLFQRFRRAVRDMAKATGKDVELILHGEATELDKRMIDELADPITHMVRNCVDHGIESPAERAATSKPKTARVDLDAYHRGRHICIEVRDDGKGIDVEAVKKKIIDRELATPSQVEQMSDKEIHQYVFKPGFSTAAQVTDLSGRGMGMDIVVNKIDNLNGAVEIDSVPDVGTCVTIKLPLTLAIITALVARIGRGVYAVPLEMVAEIITAPRSSIQSIQKRRVICVRDRVIPVALFEEIFATACPELQTVTRDEANLTLVILTVQDESMGLVVDELIGQEDVVIKNIADNYRNVAGVAGASIMGDGAVSLILDVAATMTMFAERSSGQSMTERKRVEEQPIEAAG